MLRKVTAFINNHQLMEKNSVVLVGVSGGSDSIALLSLFLSLRKAWELKLIAVSVDHQLRGETSRNDLAYVKDVCKEWDIAFEGASVDVAAYKEEHNLGTQVAARELRYQFFEAQMDKHQANYMALGHHADDQAETMLMNFARSSNPKALGGIPINRPFAAGMIIRPLLCVRKKEIESYCMAQGITPRIDESNVDMAYTRNAVRKHITPLIEELNPNVHESLQHLSEVLQEDAALLDELAKQMVEDAVTFETGKASFQMKPFLSYPSALQRRAYHLILNHLYSELPKNLSYIHERNFFRLLEKSDGNKEMDLPYPVKIVKTYECVTLYDILLEQSSDNAYDILVTVPGETLLPNGSKLHAARTAYHDTDEKFTYIFPEEQAVLPLHVRTRKKGDRMQWKGLGGSKKLKDIFIDNKVPPKKRDDWPIVTDHSGHILWLIGLRKHQQEKRVNKEPGSEPAPYIYLTYEQNR